MEWILKKVKSAVKQWVEEERSVWVVECEAHLGK